MSKEKPEVIGREFRFAFHIPAKSKDEPDYHLVKEQVHYKIDGQVTIKPELRLVRDFVRPVYFTKSALRTHKEKREFEKLENLVRMDVRQSDLKPTIARMTNQYNVHSSLRELCASPYVYAADIPSTLILRKELYEDKYKGLSTPRTVATFDTETDMNDGIGDIIITTAVFQNKAFLGVQKRKLEGYSNPGQMVNLAIERHMDNFLKEVQRVHDESEGKKLDKTLLQHILENKLEIEVFIADNEIDLVKRTFERIHSWRPDFLAIWNMNFDIPKVLAACSRANVEPMDILCDPKLPRAVRFCKYKEGSTKKVTASGKQMPIKPANQWHTLELAASFYVIDAMCCYRRIRGGAELPSYGLDAILDEELGLSKLKIPGTEKYVKGAWHRFMQHNKIFDYMVYGLFDSYTMSILDMKTKDLSQRLPYLTELTSFEEYASQTKRLRDGFYIYGLEHLGMVIASLGPKKKDPKKPEVFEDDDSVIVDGDELDEDEEAPEARTTLDRRNWVVTLRAFMSVPGQNIVKQDNGIFTLIRAFVYDSDVVSSYPNCTLVANVSKRTTRKEINSIEGVPQIVFRYQNLNIIFGGTNAAEYSQVMFGLPEYDFLAAAFERHLQETTAP